MTSLPNPFEFNPADPAECPADTAVVSENTPPGATAVTYSPEPFLEYAQRRSMPIISPPVERPPAMVGDWPRGFDPELFAEAIEPVPMFLQQPAQPVRKVSQSLLQALFELAGPER